MKRWFFTLFVLLPAFPAQAKIEAGWKLETLDYDTGAPFVGRQKLRAGYFREDPSVRFQGNILYLEGLADSIANHDPLFSALSRQGYRVIAFDYPGQGGSSGTMNHTRVVDVIFPALQISSMAAKVWNKYHRGSDKPRIVMGWSTGGLAAYHLAATAWANAVILIAPGIVVKPVVGDLNQITLPTLTSAVYGVDEKDPHVDPIRPTSPLHVPAFAGNLVASAGLSLLWTIPASVQGIAFFGGDDSYVFGEKSAEVLKVQASHFQIETYPDGKHELHNEKKEIREDLQAKVISFLNRL